MRTFVDVLRDNAAHPDRSVTFVRANLTERVVSYPDLWLEARRRGHALLAQGLRRGDRVALVLPEPDEFVLTFMGGAHRRHRRGADLSAADPRQAGGLR